MAELTRAQIEAALVSARSLDEALRPFAALSSVIVVAADWAAQSETAQARLDAMHAELEQLALKRTEAQTVHERFVSTLTSQKREERQKFETFQKDLQQARIAESDKLRESEKLVETEREALKLVQLQHAQVEHDLEIARRNMRDLAASLTGGR